MEHLQLDPVHIDATAAAVIMDVNFNRKYDGSTEATLGSVERLQQEN